MNVARRIVSRAEVRAAARVKVSVDRRLGRTTPEWVKRLAREGRMS